MNRTGIVLIAFLGLAGAVMAARAQDGWEVGCIKEQRKIKGGCATVYHVPIEAGNEARTVHLLVTLEDGGLFVIVGASGGLCEPSEATIRVDGGRTINLPRRDWVAAAEGDEAKALVATLAAGRTAHIRVSPDPDCVARDIEIPLTGFAEAYERLQGMTP